MFLQKKKAMMIAILFLVMGYCGASTLNFTGTTPTNYTNLSTNNFGAQIDITEANLSGLQWNFGGSKYSLYDTSLVLMYNFDNVAALGETGGIIKDLSVYNNTGTSYITSPIANAGGIGTTDWSDSNSDGISDNWLKFYGTETVSIVTGNGFSGNAQRMVANIGGMAQAIRPNALFKYGTRYKISFMYRTNSNIYLYPNPGWQFGPYTPINTGDAKYYEAIILNPSPTYTPTYLIFYVPNSGNRLEIDDVRFQELPQFKNDAVEFDGVDDRINSTSIGVTGKTITASLRFKVPQYQVLNGSILMEYSRDLNYSNAFGIVINCSSSCAPGLSSVTGGLVISMHDVAGGYMVKGTYDRYDDNQRHQIVSVLDKNISTTGQIKAFIDGKEVNLAISTSLNTILSQNFTNTGIFLGSRSDNTWRFSGQMDEVRIRNRVLSSGEIYQNYLSNLSKYAPDKWLFSTNPTNLLSGIYGYGITVTDILNQTSNISRTIGVNVGAPGMQFTGITPLNGSTLFTGYGVQTYINDAYLNTLTWSQNGSQNALYDTSLVLMYNFDNVTALGENTGIVKDMSVYNNTGIVMNGAVWTGNGKRNGSFGFNGSTQYIGNIGTTDAYSFIQNTLVFSISLRSKLSDITARQNFINNTNTTTEKGFIFMYETYGSGYGIKTPRFTAVKGVPGAPVINAQAPNNSILDTNWHHIVITGTGGSNSITFYIDGIKQSTIYNTQFSSLSTGESTRAANIGINAFDNSTLGFHGQIDEVRIYNRALSSGEVRQLYNSNLSKYDIDKWLLTINQTLSGITNYGINAGNMFGQINSLTRTIALKSVGEYITIPNAPVEEIKTAILSGGYQAGTGALKSIGNETVVGNRSLDFSLVSGSLAVPVIIQGGSGATIIEAEFASGTIIKDSLDNGYTGILSSPIALSLTVANALQSIRSVAAFGDQATALHFTDQSNNAVGVKIRLPVPGASIGQEEIVYYSNDNGSSWNYHTKTNVVSINNQPYVEFMTTHFTDYAVGDEVTTAGQVTFTILTGNNYCVYGNNIDLGTGGVGTTSFSGNFNTASGTNTWSCSNGNGINIGTNLTIQMSGDLVNQNNTSTIISSGNVSINFGNTVFGGSLTGIIRSGTNLSLSSQQIVFGTTGTPDLRIGTISTTGVKLQVTASENQAPGRYVGTLVITLPW